MSIALKQIAAKVGEYTGLGIVGTADANSNAAQIVDAAMGTYARDIPQNSVIYVNYDAAGGGAAPEGQQAWVTDFERATGTIAISPSTAPAVEAGDIYEVWDEVVESRLHVKEAINRVLTEQCHYWRVVPLSMLADADCQANTGWSVFGAGVKNTVLAPTAFAYPYRFGRYYLDWTATAANDYFYQNLSATENRTWPIAVLMRVPAATTATVTVYDLTNSAAITTSGDTLSVTGLTDSGSDWAFLKGSFSIPNNCDRISIRINNGTLGGHTHVAFVLAWPSDSRSLPLPDRVKGEKYVRKVYSLAEYLDVDFPETWVRGEYQNAKPVADAYGGLRMLFDSTVGSEMFAYEERTFYTALSAETDTTDCDDKYVCWMASHELARAVAQLAEIRKGADFAKPYQNLEMRMLQRAGEYSRLNAREPEIIVRHSRT